MSEILLLVAAVASVLRLLKRRPRETISVELHPDGKTVTKIKRE